MLMVATRCNWQGLQDFCYQVFMKAGLPEPSAAIVAESLVEADLRGVDSHGVVRTAIYLKRIEAGMIDPLSQIEKVSESDATVLVDGNNNFGSVIGRRALEIAMEKAKNNGAAFVGVKGSNHFGTGATMH